MKKITLSLFLLAFVITGFAQQSYGDIQPTNAEGVTINPSEGFEIVSNNLERQPILETFDNRTDFEDAYNVDCTIPLINEDFSGGPGAITTCGPVISSAGDDCFPPGVLEEGFTITSLGTGTNLNVYLPPGFLGNPSHLVGSNSFADYTIITFVDTEVFAVGQDVFNNNSLNADYRIFNADGDLIDSFTLTSATPTTENFFGFISDEPIGRIEIEGADEDGELLSNLSFGVCEVLSINDNLLSLVSVYPNPTSDILNIKVPSSVEIISVSLYSMLGKNMGTSVTNNTLDISNLTKGVYFLNLETNQGSLTQKVVKK
ncbi:MAG: T9SS type A sorting domain-containing protein [Flavobacteriaceae bacterium]